jgi:hypothetical protein
MKLPHLDNVEKVGIGLALFTVITWVVVLIQVFGN